jgi:S1 RNA binding domain protein
MPLKPGEIHEGTIEKITEYGAFVNLPENRHGLVHISEISYEYVSNVADLLQEKQKIRVKILSISPDGKKISLSIKQAGSGNFTKPK